MNRISWVAVYRDGSELHQVGPGGETSSESIDRRRLAAMRLVSGGVVLLSKEYSSGDRMYYRRRTEFRDDKAVAVCHVLARVSGSSSSYTYVFETGGAGPPAITSVPGPVPHHPWFYGVEPLECESVEVE